MIAGDDGDDLINGLFLREGKSLLFAMRGDKRESRPDFAAIFTASSQVHTNGSPFQDSPLFLLWVLARSAGRSLSNNITQRSSAVKDFV
jgi:hypothetical protein